MNALVRPWAWLLGGLLITHTTPALGDTPSELDGAYAISFDGSIENPTNTVTSFAGIGRWEFDPDGTFEGGLVLVQPGAQGNDIVREDDRGHYTRRPDGTFSLSFERFVSGTQAKIGETQVECNISRQEKDFRCILVSATLSIDGTSVPLAITAAAIGQKQRGAFSDRTVRGRYSTLFEGTLFLPDPVPVKQLGTIDTDGQGVAIPRTSRYTNALGAVTIDPPLNVPNGSYSISSEGLFVATLDIIDDVGDVTGRQEFECVVVKRRAPIKCVLLRNIAFDLAPGPIELPTLARGTVSFLNRQSP